MISKEEVLKLAKSLDLRPDTIEKDYVLGWMLHGIYTSSQLKNKWAFKGGTSLKKCFFETFRFSEDLDFTILEKNHLDSDFLLQSFHEITDSIYEQTGIEFDKNQFKFKIVDKENGNKAAHGKIHFNGPLRRKNSYTTIKLDLTNDEILVLKPVKGKVHHPYSDEPDSGISINCYAFEEVIAEKIRALAQRARPRDLYDVVHFFRNRQLILNPRLVCDILQKKCNFKKIEVPTFEMIDKHEKIDELGPQWENMLAHQLPQLPPMESFWNDLRPFFYWLEGNIQEEKLVPVSNKDEETFHLGRIVNARTVNSMLYRIQFAAANRICIKMVYKDKLRTIEPLSFRQAKNGNRIFYGFHREGHKTKAFTLSKIQSVEVTNIPYIEKYPIEITASGRISMPPVRSGHRASYSHSSYFDPGPKYVYECNYCGREFRRKKRNSILKPHKDEFGDPCSGRRGIIKDFEL